MIDHETRELHIDTDLGLAADEDIAAPSSADRVRIGGTRYHSIK